MSEQRASVTTTQVRLLFKGNPDDPYIVMIEPWGMTYALAGSDSMFVDLTLDQGELPELVAWPGGVSVYVSGRAATRDSTGALLDEF